MFARPRFIRPLLGAVAALLVAGAMSGAQASTIIGPLDDGSITLDPSHDPVEVWYQTRWSYAYMAGNDLLHIASNGNATLYLDARVFVTVPDPVPPKGGTAIVTTIYGTPRGDGLLTGFVPDSGQFVPDTPETQMGTCDKKQRQFKSYSQQEVAASDLPAYLPGMDLHQFDTTSSNVFFVFQTKVPLASLAHPGS